MFTLSRAHLATWLLMSVFVALGLTFYLVLRGNRIKTGGSILGALMSVIVLGAFGVRLLPAHIIIQLGYAVDPLGHCPGPVSVFEADFASGIGAWIVMLTICAVSWRVGHLAGSSEGCDVDHLIEYMAVWAMLWLAVLVSAQSGVSSVCNDIAAGIPPWSLWSALAGLFAGWGAEQRA